MDVFVAAPVAASSTVASIHVAPAHSSAEISPPSLGTVAQRSLSTDTGSRPAAAAALIPPIFLLASWLRPRRRRGRGFCSTARAGLRFAPGGDSDKNGPGKNPIENSKSGYTKKEGKRYGPGGTDRAGSRFSPGGESENDLPELPALVTTSDDKLAPPPDFDGSRLPRWAPGGQAAPDVKITAQGGIIATEALEEQSQEREVFDGKGRLYRVTYDLGIGVRTEDSIFSSRTGRVMQKGEVFAVTTIVRRGGRCYFELADGRGWVFDWVMEDGIKYPLCELAAQLYSVAFPDGVSGITWGSDPTMRFAKVYDFATAEQQQELSEAGVRLNDILVMIDKEPVIGVPFGQVLERIWAVAGRQPGAGIYYKITTDSPYGIGVRAEPDAQGPRTGDDLARGAIFEVDRVIPVEGGPDYLRLADGRGWVFDTTPLDGEDGTCKRLRYEDRGGVLTLWRGSVQDLAKVVGINLTAIGPEVNPHTVTVYEDGMAPVKIRVADGANLRGCLVDNGFNVYADLRGLFHCSAQQLCGTCIIHILDGYENITPRTVNEKAVMERNPRNYRLSCNADIYGDCAVKVRPANVYYGGGTS